MFFFVSSFRIVQFFSISGEKTGKIVKIRSRIFEKKRKKLAINNNSYYFSIPSLY
jgi:hypothetical protein